MELYQRNLLGRMLNKVKSIFHWKKSWKDIEYFDERWKDRVKFMAQYIDEGTTVLDLGCGKMSLKNYLPKNCRYIPVDYRVRSSDTLVADFNKNEFPTLITDISFISGSLEYINDYMWFLRTTGEHTHQKIILSYCVLDTHPDIRKRKQLHWVNHLSAGSIENAIQTSGFKLAHKGIHDSNTIFVFIKCTK
jgi:hypothetical protein